MNKSWTKYGGGRGGNEAIYNDRDWYCQSCQRAKTVEDTVFTYYHNALFLRICESCAGDDCAPLKRRLANLP